ncbi:hypothetical protein HDU97_002357 [Phlyctochytrium planicorne]|nr:hypothetical protein HDU97_002357 [Phlyctochytrium planicorne]
MAPVISAISLQLGELLNVLMDYASNLSFRVAFVGYRDFDAPQRYTIYDFTEYQNLSPHLAKVVTELGRPSWTQQMVQVFSSIYQSRPNGVPNQFVYTPMCETVPAVVEETFFSCVLEAITNKLRAFRVLKE